jgi:hypothetical protein
LAEPNNRLATVPSIAQDSSGAAEGQNCFVR